jgi:large subunit ribosomal protein L14
MIYVQTKLKVVDSSGARDALCIRVLKKAPKNPGHIGDHIVVAIKTATPGKKVKRGEIHKAVIVRSGRWIYRMMLFV